VVVLIRLINKVVYPMRDVDFGTYHHSTPEESNHLREGAKKAFSKLLRSLYPSRAALKILDAGCGLGFLTYVAAKCFPKATITSVDLFRRGGMSELSMDKAANNMKSLGMESRTSFLKHDLTKPMKSDEPFDLVVSNLVFHSMGKKKFVAYGNVFDALKPEGYFVIGDLFPHGKADMDYFRERSTLINELEQGGSGRWHYQIKVLQKMSQSKLTQRRVSMAMPIHRSGVESEDRRYVFGNKDGGQCRTRTCDLLLVRQAL
jgi:cyclopropane fatty-acyl-phospholipid synthase-like methyltransferase